MQRLAPLRTIDFGDIGLGDNLMAWAGLYALLHHDFRPAAPGCILYVPDELVGLADAVFAVYDLSVRGVRLHAPRTRISPVLTTFPPERLQDWLTTYAGPDWRMNCFEAIDAQKTIPRFEEPPRTRDRIRLYLSELVLYRRLGWKAAVAEYVGYRLWRPLAQKLGVPPLPFLTLVKRALPSLRREAARYVDGRAGEANTAPCLAIFPSGKSFQAFPPAFCKQLQDRLPGDQTRFYVHADDPWINEYRDAGLSLKSLGSLEELYFAIRAAKAVLTTDSFSSHIAQWLRDDFVLALTRDFQENIVHPGAHPTIVANHPPCAPCSYVPRTDSRHCSANHDRCVAFADAQFLNDLTKALLSHAQRDANGAAVYAEPLAARE